MNEETKQRLSSAAQDVRDHFDQIEQDVPDQSFVVGGFVRDTIMNLDANDMDFVTVGETPDTMKARGFEPIEASSFPVFHDSDNEEWALARREEKDGYVYDGFEVFTDDVSLEHDLERRDLTLNSMALDPYGEWGSDVAIYSDDGFVEEVGDVHLLDPNDGVEDLQNGVLRHVSDAFAEDPLRVLRVARYAARFAVPTGEHAVEFEDCGESYHDFAVETESAVHNGFQIAEETETMIRQVSPEINRMSRDRIGDEIVKAMEQARCPSRFWKVLEDTGALAVVWTDLHRATIVPAGPEEHHAEGSTFDHTMMVVDRMHRLCEEHGVDGHDKVRRLLMAVAHDIGKVLSADKQGGLHSDDPPTGFPGHDDLGESATVDAARRMGIPKELEAAMEDACHYHMDFHDVNEMEPLELLEFFEPIHSYPENGLELPTGPDGDSWSHYSVTARELLDLAHADHEGRLKVTMQDEIQGTDLVRTMAEAPEFDRESYVERIEAIDHANEEVNGYEALESGLCEEHRSASGEGEGSSPIDRVHGVHEDEEQSVQGVMKRCDSCRTPDTWVGDRVKNMRIDVVEEVLFA